MDSKYYDMSEFREYLRSYTNKAESTIKLYARTINRYLSTYSEVNIENINKFVSAGFRKGNVNYIKYAFRYYLKWIKKESIYKDIVKVRINPKKSRGNYKPREDILKIINNIHKEKQHDLCMLQYILGCRARGIISLKEENVYFDRSPLLLILIEKGNTERITYLSEKHRSLLEKYKRDKAGFMFLDQRYNLADDKDIDTAINTQRQYMYEAIQESIQELGIPNFGTHDFRRNVADYLIEKHGLYSAQQTLGHSDPRTTAGYGNKGAARIDKAILDHQEE